MANLLTNIGEEWLVENDPNGATLTVGLYNDSTDGLGDTSTLGNISTEPVGAAYSRQTSAVTTRQIGSDYGFDNDSQISFDTSDSSQDVDHALYIVTFQSAIAGDGSPQDHLIGVTALSQSRDLSQLDTLDIAAQDLDLTLD